MVYRDNEKLPGGHTYEMFGNAGGDYQYKRLKLKSGDYVQWVEGLVGSQIDELKIITKRGRELKAGVPGGNDYVSPDFGCGNIFILGFDTAWGTHMTGLTIYYVDLERLFPFAIRRYPEMTDSPSEHSSQHEEAAAHHSDHSSKKSDKSKKSKKSDKSSKKSSKSSHKSD